MGRHEFPGAVAAHDQDDAMREQAADLVARLNYWFEGPLTAPMPPASDLVEWCRSARDILAAVARG